MYKKITREVRLLSNLNHENVVRFVGLSVRVCMCVLYVCVSGAPIHHSAYRISVYRLVFVISISV